MQSAPSIDEPDDPRTAGVLAQIGDRLHDWEHDALREVLRLQRPGRVMTIDSHNHLSFVVHDRFVDDQVVKMIVYVFTPEDPYRDSEVEVTRELVYASARPMACQTFLRMHAAASIYASDLQLGGGSGFEAHILPDTAQFIGVASTYDIPTSDTLSSGRELLTEGSNERCWADEICFAALLNAFDRIMECEATR